MKNNATRTIRSGEITIDVRICAALAANRGGEVYLAAIAPDMELTVITLDETPDILPCFDEDDACLNLPDTSLLLCYNPAQVLKMGGKHYLTGPVILVRTNMDGEVISLTIDEVYLFQKYLASHSITLMADDQKLPCICIDWGAAMSTRAEFFQSMYPGLSDGEVIDELIKASIYGFEHGPEVVTISAAEGIHYVPYDAEMQKKLPYYGGTYEVCNIPFTDFQIRYQPEQIRIVDSKRILEDTAFLCRKDNDHFLILPSVYEKLDLDDWLLAHLFFYDKDGKRCIGVELSEVD